MQEIHKILRNLSEGRNTVQLQPHNVADPAPHNFEKLDRDLHQSGKLNRIRIKVKSRIRIHIEMKRGKP
jgi:hypothetical protein